MRGEYRHATAFSMFSSSILSFLPAQMCTVVLQVGLAKPSTAVLTLVPRSLFICHSLCTHVPSLAASNVLPANARLTKLQGKPVRTRDDSKLAAEERPRAETVRITRACGSLAKRSTALGTFDRAHNLYTRARPQIPSGPRVPTTRPVGSKCR